MKLDSSLHFLKANKQFLIRTDGIEWSSSPLGEPETWPQSLRSVVSLILNSKFPMFIAWGPELGFIYNEAYADILGTKHPSAFGQRFKDIWSEIWDDVNPLVQRALGGEATYVENFPLLMHRKGYDEQTWFTFSYSPLTDESGGIAGMYCACTETTQQVLAERHRHEENERLRLLFQQAPGIMAVMRGPSHVFELVNDAYTELVGPRVQVGMPVREALPELAGQGFYELLDKVFDSGEPFVGRAIPIRLKRNPDGELEERFVDFIYQPIRDYMGKVSGIFLEGSDVTEAVRATNALRESEQRLLQLANNIPHLTWIADREGMIQWCNDRWIKYTGSPLEMSQGKAWQAFYEPDFVPAILREWQKCVAEGAPFEGTYPMPGANGERRVFYTLAAPLRDASGTIIQWFGTNTDVTQIEMAQNEIKEASLRKDEFLAMLAHELRNPLAPISTAAQLLKISSHDKNNVARASEIISRQVRHMTNLVDDLLDVSRVTRGLVELDKQYLDLKSIVSEAIEQVRPLIEARHHILATRVDAGHVTVHADRTRLIQVVSNLLNNAAKYTPQNGEITLLVEASDASVKISVRDNGIGIDAKLLPHVFDLFTQAARTPDRSQGGLGIGLALVKSIMVLHGGHAEVCSDGAGRGSTFSLTLPRAERPMPDQISGSMESSIAGGNAVNAIDAGNAVRVLLVDDNVDAAHTLAALLESKGHRVNVAEDAASALRKAEIDPPQVFILDIGLPDMDGYALARRLHEQAANAQATYIALTGYGQAHDRVLSRTAGFDYHFVKPMDTEVLAEILSKVSGSSVSLA